MRLQSPENDRPIGRTSEATTSATGDLTNGECKLSETGLSSPESRCSFGGEFASSFEEQEQALLDLCIISGMRKCRHDEGINKHENNSLIHKDDRRTKDRCSVCKFSSYTIKFSGT